MNPIIKMPFNLLSDALTDLGRTHPFASERVGFFSFRLSSDSETPLLICYEYHLVPDHQYVRDDTCGACIGPESIRAAMERALASGCGQLHVHMHRRAGASSPSGIDLASGPGMSRSFANAMPAMPHGWVVLSETHVAGQVLFPSGKTVSVRDLAVVGQHMKTPRRWSSRHRTKVGRKGDRFSRQSFLGPDSQRIIEDARIGIVGLGGGGSHIVQQLAYIGFKNYVLCDMDRVEETNLNRLVGATVQDCRKKRFKAEIAARVIKKLQPDAIVDCKPGNWEDKLSALCACDIIFGCLDGYMGRRDLEIFCRGQLIPLIDIGMDVHLLQEGRHEIYGQIIVSMPGFSCLRCVGLLTEEKLAEEGQAYGTAGHRPQVIWPNGALASAALGVAVDLLTNWTGKAAGLVYLEYRGSSHTIKPSHVGEALCRESCSHFPLSECGDPRVKMVVSIPNPLHVLRA
jgi:hypothetical protein